MASLNHLLEQAAEYVQTLLTDQLKPAVYYHNLGHTQDVVNAVSIISKGENLNEEERCLVSLAAWFHDSGHIQGSENHEERSIKIARGFFENKAIDGSQVDMVCGCIAATKMPQSPRNKLENVLCDADLFHISDDTFMAKSALLRKEWEVEKGEILSDKKWFDLNLEFLEGHTFCTDYAKENMTTGKLENKNLVMDQIQKVKKKSKEQKLESKILLLEEKLAKAKSKENIPIRGIETMFRITSKNHLDLSAMADNKANIMISINAIMLSIIMSVLLQRLSDFPHFTIPALILTAVCLVTIILSILATRPNVSKGTFSKEDLMNNRTNLLFFGNFHSMSLKDYEWGMNELMKNSNYLYGSLIKDIYFLGAVLGKKYKYLRWAYTVFMFGFVIAVCSFIAAGLYDR